MSREMHCPLCDGPGGDFHRDRRRPYLRCGRCLLVWVPPAFLLAPEREKAEYDLHQNRPDDPAYRGFLGRLAGPLLQRLAAGCSGLEFGCGPGPALAAMLREAGHRVSLYDPFYFPNPGALEVCYDFITATEVVEHLHRPGAELERLWALLRPGGTLGIMTKLVRDREAFATWHYKNDPTHVCFFSRDTWNWWAQCHGATAVFPENDVILLRKNAAT
ncbi:class I SAM-dependent methyltransferase [Haliea sp. E1-2-M8]|uniref:class I SAM-dependent methyltransferase n=1 Tax=Haliea sp. E1-2-M8 TaxID=3064706 RepID=UPI00271A7679|nr:class I SAM-dependent methyltransferase [Haliea sp. E1-2-M8]MDO8861764.1 class I SAM-dependent methyltransferase [Haliea sp. E1-2-M8]